MKAICRSPDLYSFFLQAIEGINTSVITSQFSRIQALVDKIDALPAVKKYYGGK